jgi:hypothetical protein
MAAFPLSNPADEWQELARLSPVADQFPASTPLPLAIVSFRVIEFARPFQKNVPLKPAGQLIRFHRRVMN